MNALRLLPVILSCGVLGAHFLRAGLIPAVIICGAVPLMLFVRRPWVVRALQIFLVVGALEWVRILVELTRMRQAAGEPWIRLVVILSGVALFTGLSALVFRSRSLRKRYQVDDVLEKT